ncbi:4-(cytidine 5'-diphospho)-2-C-methyl-D-erythritol kinase [Verrucomicrobiota bacterium]
MSNQLERLYVKSPAKVNLYLEVLGVRNNGYHDIRSIVVPVSLYDVLALERTDKDVRTIIDSDALSNNDEMRLINNEDNLATKAARLLQQETGCSCGAEIQIKKNIPVGGGLGGGSADAAAVLIGLNQLWDLGLPRKRLSEISLKLGCDVPAMVCGGTLRMEGLGEKIAPIAVDRDNTGLWIVIVNPCFGVSTGDIYSRYSSVLTSNVIPVSSMVSAVKDGNVELVAKSLFNSLEKTVFRKYPLIEIIAEELKKAGAIGVLLSGSGASVFGLGADEKQAREIEKLVNKALGASIWSRVATTLPDGVMVAHGPLEA